MLNKLPSAKIQLHINKDIAEIMPRYLENRHRDITILEESLSRDNFESIQVIGHRLKGNARSYGMEFLEEIGTILESSSKIKDAPTIANAITGMKDYLARIDIVYI